MNTRIYMGAGSLEKIRDLEIERAYIICDPFMKQSGKADQIAALLSERGACWEIFSEVVPDPTIGVVTKGIEGKMCIRDRLGAIGILTLTPYETAIIAADVAVKASGVQVGFLDRFTGSVVVAGDVESVETALRAVCDCLERGLGFAVTGITRT